MSEFEEQEGGTRRDDPGSERPYHAFLLRCWQEENGWRYSLEAIGSTAGERRRQGFDSVDAFLARLQSELARLADAAGDTPAEGDL
ncbi:MAG TPA: hypothetical protein VK879_19600 [Candidatus Sulfomarinibacteraceae bacterium]|nr:hypothetical protein [Candidatus Sulfomarinibacteraceae bacterium]